jgi:hypothetical protein
MLAVIQFAGITLDLTITAGTIVEVAVIAGGGLLALSRLSTKFALFHADLTNVKTDVGDMKEDIKKVNQLLATTAEADRRIGRIEDIVYGLARGDGWVTGHKRHSVDGEYPTPT